jgi:DNA-3-methyladenine glycosylase
MFDRAFLERPSVEVAPLLLGAIIHGRGVSVRLTEVEAYMGDIDPGSHSFRGQTNRNAVMFGEPGHLYNYFTYGMHVCANVVCSPLGTATGILLRAGEVIDGIDVARERRTSSRTDTDLAQGPARLVVALGILLSDNGDDLESGAITLELATSVSPYQQGPRTGVSGPGGTSQFPWRFWIPGDPTVSPYKPSVPKKRAVASDTTVRSQRIP